MFQHFDRVNEKVGGILVPVQGSFNIGTTASAGTHDKAGAWDIRTWNLTTEQRQRAMRVGRDPSIVGGAAWWYRTSAQGFDPHIHLVLLGDAPMTPQTFFQVTEYKAGRNGLASRRADDFWRPPVIQNYRYIEDDMFTDKDRELLLKTWQRVDGGFTNERKRDQAEREKDNERFSRVVTALGGLADRLGELQRSTSDDATRAQLRRTKEEILAVLSDEPDVVGPDNPAPDAEL